MDALKMAIKNKLSLYARFLTMPVVGVLFDFSIDPCPVIPLLFCSYPHI